MSNILNNIRNFIAVDSDSAKKEAFKQVSMINGVGGAEESFYVPPDMRQTNKQTILDGRGKLVSGEVLPEDYAMGDTNLIAPVVSAFWLFIVMIGAMLFRNDGSSIPSIDSLSPLNLISMFFSMALNIKPTMALVLGVITYLHFQTTEKWFGFLIICLLEIMLVNGAMHGSFVVGVIAFTFPGVRLIYSNWKNRRNRVVRIKILSKTQSADHAENTLDLNHLKILALDETPVFPVGKANGAFADEGYQKAVSKGTMISCSQKDKTRHTLYLGASGEGKSETLKQNLQKELTITKNHIEKLKKENPNAKFKPLGGAVFCGKGDLPFDLGLKTEGGILDGILQPETFDDNLGKIVGYKHIALFKGLTPEKVTSSIVSVNGGGSKSKAGDNKIFDVTGESLTYRSAVALRFLKDYNSLINGKFKWAPSHLYAMFSELVKRKESKDSNGNVTYVNNNDVLDFLRAINKHLLNQFSTNLKDKKLELNIKVLQGTIKFAENCLNDDIQKFIQSVVATSQSWISSLTENAELLDWNETDEDEAEFDPILEIMTQSKWYGWALKFEKFGNGSKLIQNLHMERLLSESAIRGKSWQNPDSNQNQFSLIMDEAQDILNESLVKNYSKKLRSWGCSLTVLTQNLSTLVDRFGKETVMGFVGDIANHIVFNPKDEFTLKYYTERLQKIKNYESIGSGSSPYDFRATVSTLLQRPTFDNENPYFDIYKKLRSTVTFNKPVAIGKTATTSNSYSAINRGGWFGSLISNIMGKIFGGNDSDSTIDLFQYTINKQYPTKDLFSDMMYGHLNNKGQALVIVERGGKRRTDICTMYVPNN